MSDPSAGPAPDRDPDAANATAPYRIRLADMGDAKTQLALQLRLDEQTPFMMHEPGERPRRCRAAAADARRSR